MFNEPAQQVRIYAHPEYVDRINPDVVYDALFECLD